MTGRGLESRPEMHQVTGPSVLRKSIEDPG